MSEFLFTSESVTAGTPTRWRPDLRRRAGRDPPQDPRGRVACETMVTTGLSWWPGRSPRRRSSISPTLSRKAVTDIGYTGNS